MAHARGLGWFLFCAALAAGGCTSTHDGDADAGVRPDASMYVWADAGVRRDSALPDAGAGSRDARVFEGDAAVTAAEPPPPPVSGGTLLASADGLRAIAADPDRDRVYVVDLSALTLAHSIALYPGDEPGRLVEDGRGRVHVVLRRAGAIATIDPIAGTVVSRTAVCAAPRGIAWEAAPDVIHVACAGGELVTLPAAGGPAVRTRYLDDDLRDVVVGAPGGGLWVTRFRSAEVLMLDADGAVTRRLVAPSIVVPMRPAEATFVPNVAWRAISTSSGLLVLHQRAQQNTVDVESTGYGMGPCEAGVVVTSMTSFDTTGTARTIDINFSVLAVDVALTADGTTIAIANAGANPDRVRSFAVETLAFSELGSVGTCGGTERDPMPPGGRAVAVAYVGSSLMTLTREPATLTASGTVIVLDSTSRRDTGHEVFHVAAGFRIACASCHPEGGDDGHVWDFMGVGPRRTQTLRGGILGTEPFHWNGDERDMSQIMFDGFVGRMGGPEMPPGIVSAVAAWIDTLPAPAHSPDDPARIARGAALFASNSCADCHSGALGTNNATVDIGTGGAFQVPWLVGVGARAPYLHDGCAATLDEVFGVCADAGQHRVTLSPPETTDLVAYLKTL